MKWELGVKEKLNPFLKTVTLKTDEELLFFNKKASMLIGVDFPLEYLKQGTIRGFINSEGDIVGGYALITSAPFRTVRSLPDETYLKYDQNELFEVTALWMEKSVRTGVLRTQFWCQFVKDVYGVKDKKYYIYAYGLYNTKLRKIYSKARPDIIYRGPVKMLEGNVKEERESVEVARTSIMKFMPVLALPSITKRLVYTQNDFVKNRTAVKLITGRL